MSLTAWLLKLLGFLKDVREMEDGKRCCKCGEKYVGLAMDCACTDWGR